MEFTHLTGNVTWILGEKLNSIISSSTINDIYRIQSPGISITGANILIAGCR